MHISVSNLIEIEKEIHSKNLDQKSKIKIIAVTKTFSMDNILPLIDHGHTEYGENKVQEAVDKWSQIKLVNKNLNLHMIGKLQTNKVKMAVKLFDYIHSLDSMKLAKKIYEEQNKIKKNLKIFIQVNVGNESQKGGIMINELSQFYQTCTNDYNLDIIGLMCIPPIENDPSEYFEKIENAAKKLSLNNLIMGMSSDYLKSIDFNSNFIKLVLKSLEKKLNNFYFYLFL